MGQKGSKMRDKKSEEKRKKGKANSSKEGCKKERERTKRGQRKEKRRTSQTRQERRSQRVDKWSLGLLVVTSNQKNDWSLLLMEERLVSLLCFFL